MDIKAMMASHQEMIDTMTASLKKRGFDERLIHRPIEMHEERAALVKARIEALEAARHDYVARVEDDIKTLKGELSTVEARIKAERKNVAAIKASALKSSEKRSSRSAPSKSSTKRSSKAPRRT